MYIDISSNNGDIDFQKVAGNVSEIFIRSSLGFGDIDKRLFHNAILASSAGIPVSYYHFAYPHDKVSSVSEDAIKQANYFCDTISHLPAYISLAVDLENFTTTTDTKLSKNDYGLWLKSFLDTVESRTAKKCIIYTYASYLNQHLSTDHAFGEYPLWIANYGNAESPSLPIGWNKYFAWQYSEIGTIPGISGHVDISKLSS